MVGNGVGRQIELSEVDGLTLESASVFEPYPALSLHAGDETVYRKFRTLEPQLHSHMDREGADSGPELRLLHVAIDREPAGAASWFLAANEHRPPPRDHYARIDLVIVPEQFRGLGLGRLVILTTLLEIVTRHADVLYSISSLAAHAAVEKVLEEAGFHGEPREDANFVHESIDLDETSLADLRASLTDATRAAAQAANYRIRQRRADR